MSILGAGQVSACGRGVDALRSALRGAFPGPTWMRRPHAPGEAAVPVFAADASGLGDLLGARQVRRLDAFARRFLLAARLAERDAGGLSSDPERIGTVVATGYGSLGSTFRFLDGIIDDGDDMGPPFRFSGSVHNAPAASLSALMGLRGPSLTVTAFAHAWSRALDVAAGWLDAGRADRVLVAAGDEYHELVARGLASLGGWPEHGRIRPLDFDSCTYVPGETFVALLLAPADTAEPRWGRVDAPRFFGGVEGTRLFAGGPVFLGAKGERSAGPAYRKVARAADGVVAPVPLWGASPTCDAMTTLAAAIALRDRFYPVTPGTGDEHGDVAVVAPGSPCDVSRIHCVSCDTPGEGVAMTVHADVPARGRTIG